MLVVPGRPARPVLEVAGADRLECPAGGGSCVALAGGGSPAAPAGGAGGNCVAPAVNPEGGLHPCLLLCREQRRDAHASG